MSLSWDWNMAMTRLWEVLADIFPAANGNE